MSPLFGRTETPPLWASLEIFQGLGQRAMKELEAVLEPVDFPAGTEIIKQGAEGRDMFLLDNGAVRIVVKDENGQVGFERLLKAPAHFGEMALIIREPRTASVIAETDVHCKRMARPALQQLVRRNPDAAGFLTRAVGERLLEAGTIRQVGQYHVVGKLGVGGVATVFEANDPKLDRPVALKMLSHALVMQPGFAERF